MEATFVGMAFFFALLVLAGPFIFILVLVRVLRGNSRGAAGRFTAQETKVIQEIHRGLAGLEKRVENLETILLERGRSSGAIPEALDRGEGR